MKSLINVRLAEARMTKVKLAKELGVRPETIWSWSTDKGVESMTLRVAAKVASVLGCKPQDLFED